MKRIVIIIVLVSAILVSGILVLHNFKKPSEPLRSTRSDPAPTTTNEKPIPTVALKKDCRAITILSPKDNEKVRSPLIIRAEIDNRKECHWTVFEAQAGTIKVTDGLGTVIGQGILKTTQEWTAPTTVIYTASIKLSKPSTSAGTLTLTEENPGGKPKPQQVSVPLSF